MLCDYGCGQEATYQFKNGKWCCSKQYNSCPNMKKIPWNKGKVGSQKAWNKGKVGAQKAWNKGLTGIYSKETLKKMSESSKGLSSFKGQKHSIESRNKISKSHILTIKKIIKRYPTFAKIEEMRYNPNKLFLKEMQVHCKNHNCPNSKEQGGWFTPTGYQFDGRRRAIEDKNGNGGNYLYCSDECKESCSLFNKSVPQLIKLDQIDAGLIEDPWYTSTEYITWRNYILDLDEDKCIWCGKPAEHVHHIYPMKTHPNLALDPENGVACCRECHYKYGHRDRWCTTGYLSTLVCERIIRIQDKQIEHN